MGWELLVSVRSCTVLSLPSMLHPMLHPSYLFLLRTADVIKAVENGVDVFDGAYPYMVTQRDSALVFPLCWSLDHVDSQVMSPLEISLGDDRLGSQS